MNVEELHAFERQMRRQWLWLSKNQTLAPTNNARVVLRVIPWLDLQSTRKHCDQKTSLMLWTNTIILYLASPRLCFLARSNSLCGPKLRIHEGPEHEGELELKTDQIVYLMKIVSQLRYKCFYIGPIGKMNTRMICQSDVDILCRTPHLTSAAHATNAV